MYQLIKVTEANLTIELSSPTLADLVKDALIAGRDREAKRLAILRETIEESHQPISLDVEKCEGEPHVVGWYAINQNAVSVHFQ